MENMSLLITNVRMVDPASGRDETGSLYMEKGKFAPLPEKLPADCRVLEGEGLAALPGLVDMHVHLRDPGQTHKEDLHTGARAAAAGGVTSLLAMPNTSPAVDNPCLLYTS